MTTSICGAREPGAGEPNYCDLKRGHAGSHRSYDGHAWPRVRRGRRKKKNPGPLLFWAVGGLAVAGAATAALVLLSKKKDAAAANAATNAGRVFIDTDFAQKLANVDHLDAASCAGMRNGTIVTDQSDLDACDRLGL